jgi:hypothetical protein
LYSSGGFLNCFSRVESHPVRLANRKGSTNKKRFE